MISNLLLSLSLLLGLNISSSLQVPTLVFDLSTHTGHVFNEINIHTYSFPILSGQKRVVNYIGQTYYAETPEKIWEAKSLEKKGDRVTFGDSGRFLRLYDKGKRTSYGIHPYKYYEREYEKGNVYVSMGCIIVSEENMDIIQKFYERSDSINVVTTKNPSLFIKGFSIPKKIALDERSS